MIRVAAYLNGIPVGKEKLAEKTRILTDFIQGVNVAGDRGILIQSGGPVECDVAVIQGFVHEHGKVAPHLQLRKAVLDFQKARGKRTVVVDGSLFLYRDPSKQHFRFSYDGIFPTTGEYCNQNSLPGQWNKISNRLNIQLKPWRIGQGRHILVCLQRNGGWSMKNLDVVDFLQSILIDIRKYSNLPIVVRTHPGDKKSKLYEDKIKALGVHLSTTPNIINDLDQAYACIVYNSSPSVASVIEGVPTIVIDPEFSQAKNVSHHQISDLKNLQEFDRTQWIYDLAQCHWNWNDLSSGECWKHMKKWAVR